MTYLPRGCKIFSCEPLKWISWDPNKKNSTNIKKQYIPKKSLIQIYINLQLSVANCNIKILNLLKYQRILPWENRKFFPPHLHHEGMPIHMQLTSPIHQRSKSEFADGKKWCITLLQLRKHRLKVSAMKGGSHHFCIMSTRSLSHLE